MSVPVDRWPLGFRFRPTDEELINSYLKLKINGQIRPSDAAAVADVDVCRFEPWDLPAMSAIKSDDPEWFFFAPVDRKYPSGNRTNRSTLAGYWKATGNDRSIRTRAPGGARVVVGMKKTLVFHRGRAPRGERTHWIMHEYRAVERDFKEGGFVLCRLFRKPEETVYGTVTSEPEESVFAATPTKSSLSNTLHADDVVERDFAAPLNQKSLESDLQEESRPSPDTNNNQLTESKLHDKESYSIPHPNKPEESHSNGNMNTVEGGQMAERKEAALYDEVQAFLGAEYEHLLSDELPQIEGISSDVDHGLHTEIQYPKLEEDAVLDFLESMLCTPETPSATKAVLRTRSWVHADLPYLSRDVDSEALFARGGDGLEASSQERQLSGIGSSSEPDTSNRLHCEILGSMKLVHNNVKRSKRKSTARTESGTLPSHSTNHAEDSVDPANSLLTEINVNFQSLEDSTNLPTQQGIAERKFRSRSQKHLVKASEQASYESKPSPDMLFNRSSTASSYQVDLEKPSVQPGLFRSANSIKHQNLSGAKSWAGVIQSKAEVRLGNQNSRRIEVYDYDCCSLDDDGTSPPYEVRVPTPKEYKKPSLRLWTRRISDTTSDAELKPERLSLNQGRSTLRSVPIHRIGMAALVTVSLLFAGAVWFFN